VQCRYSPDHVDALVWALTELMVEATPGFGIIEYARLQVEKMNARNDPNDRSGFISMKAPLGISFVQLMSGRGMPVPADRNVDVSQEDAGPLFALGWIPNNLEAPNG
jgi:hypothetical protein